jgi:acetoin utilization deacetylase AcuC-like enzyme
LSSEIKIAYAPIYSHPLPEGHRFPMLKYELIPGQLLHEGTISPENLFVPRPCSEEVVLWTHTQEYLSKLLTQTLTDSQQRRIGFPQSPQLIQRELIITQGTIDCCRFALQAGIALNIAGGTHHAFADRGEGFCLLNDQAVAANYLLQHRLAEKILIIDLDVHQGNGTAKLFEHQARVFTCSLHGKHNYPFHKEKSDLDVPLDDGTDDAVYLTTLSKTLNKIFEEVKPDFCFYQSGVDILETDKFGKLKVSLQGCKQRDEMVFALTSSLKVPCVVSMGGGYSPDVKNIVDAHCNTFRAAFSSYSSFIF